MFSFVWSSCERRPDYPKESHLPHLVITCPSQMWRWVSNPGCRVERFTTAPVGQPLLWKWSNSDCREVEGIMFHPQTTCWYAPVLICIRVDMHPCWYAPVLICTRVDMLPCWYGPVLIWTRVDMHPCWFAPVLICTCDKHERVLEQQVSRI